MASSSRTFLINASTRHAIFVQRFAGSQMKVIRPYAREAEKALIGNLTRYKTETATKAQSARILSGIDRDLASVYANMAAEVTDNLKDFAQYEAEFSTRMFSKGSKARIITPSRRAVNRAMLRTKFALGDKSYTLPSAFKQFSAAKRKEVQIIIKAGLAAGKRSSEIVRDVITVTDTVHVRQANALVRTMTARTSTAATQAVIEENKKSIKGVEWVSVLDGSTTHTCQALDARIFPVDSGPRPPIHWGCRSTVIPVFKKRFNLLPAIAAAVAIAAYSKDKKDRPAVGEDGAETVQGNTTYNSWLKRQPASFQDEVLGPQRAALFREGGLTVRQFVDKNYQPLTLEQLKRREPLAFEKAGLDE